ncbi:chaplin family protein [Actinoplanes sp. NPDC026623]|uniref:chaplin family protein n=1 Tax=Actinoplanes sp. NPDC026623 TaxID=3155610 RepID=UPI0033DC51D9
MKTWVRKTLSVGVLAAGALLFAPGAAHADVNSQGTVGNLGLINGSQLMAPVSVPVNLTGNADSVLGISSAAAQSANNIESGKVEGGRHRRIHRGDQVQQVSQGNFGIGNGTQVYMPISVPVNMVGNGFSFLGIASAAGTGVNNIESGREECGGGRGCRGGHGTVVGQSSAGNVGFLNGTQFYTPINIPVNMCGNSLSVLGLTQAQGACVNNIESARVTESKSAGHSRSAAKTESGIPDVLTQSTGGNFGIGNGTQIAAPINIPVNICGNSFSLLGASSATAQCANNIGTSADCSVTVVKNCKGHRPAHRPGNRPDNAGDHGGQYAGDNGNNDDKYGDQGRKGAKMAGKGESGGLEGVDGLAQSLSNAGGLNVAGLNVMDALNK